MFLDEVKMRQLRTGIDGKILKRAYPVSSRLVALSPTGVMTFFSSSVTTWPGKRDAWIQFVEMLDWEAALAKPGNLRDKANAAIFGDVRVSCNCLTADVKVSLLDGRSLSMVELLEEYGTERAFWLYSTDDEGNFVPAKAYCLGIINNVKETVLITLDNKKSFESTLDHPIRLRSGEYKEAKDVRSGDSLMPLYRRTSEHGYEEILSNSEDGSWLNTHRLVADVVRGAQKISAEERCGDQYLVVHHADFDKKNNDPDNLIWMGVVEHWFFHAALASGWSRAHVAFNKDWADPEKRKLISARLSKVGKMVAQKYPELVKKWSNTGVEWSKAHPEYFAERMRNLWAARYDEMLEAVREAARRPSSRKKKSDNMRLRWEDDESRAKLIKSIKQHFAQPGAKDAKRREQKEAWKDPALLKKHSDIMTEIAARPITRDKRTAALKRNWADPEYKQMMSDKFKLAWIKRRKREEACPDIKQIRSERLKVGWAKKKEKERKKVKPHVLATVNHSVISVKRITHDETVPVYDLTVPSTQNFLLDAGIIVHNCPSELYHGYKYILTQLGALYEPGIDWEGEAGPENRFPQVRNPRLEGVVCKHLANCLYVATMSGSVVARLIKEMVREGSVVLPQEIEPQETPEDSADAEEDDNAETEEETPEGEEDA